MNLLCAPGRVAFSIGGLDIYWYAIMITIGMLLALMLVAHLLEKRGVGMEFALELFLWVVVLAVIFCRVLSFRVSVPLTTSARRKVGKKYLICAKAG